MPPYTSGSRNASRCPQSASEIVTFASVAQGTTSVGKMPMKEDSFEQLATENNVFCGPYGPVTPVPPVWLQ